MMVLQSWVEGTAGLLATPVSAGHNPRTVRTGWSGATGAGVSSCFSNVGGVGLLWAAGGGEGGCFCWFFAGPCASAVAVARRQVMSVRTIIKYEVLSPIKKVGVESS